MGDFMTAERIEVPRNYEGFKGLYTHEIPRYVMNRNAIIDFFRRNLRYETQYAYPCAVSDALASALFSIDEVDGDTITLKAENTSNQKPHLWLNTIGSYILPREFNVRDKLRFFNNEEGFGEGSAQITTLECSAAGPERGCMTRLKVMIASQSLPVADRPALFLKVAREANPERFYNNIALFFPAQVGGCAHSVVKHGEAFVLAPEGHELSEQEILDITLTFNRLVDTSGYGEGATLCEIGTVDPINAQQNQHRP